MILPPEKISTDVRRDGIDFLIIGSGAAGSVLAYHLAQAGKKVVVLEKGHYWPPEAMRQRELFMTAGPWWAWVSHPRYDLVDGSRRLGAVLESEEKALGRPAVLIGEWTGSLSLENQMICYYVKASYNQRPEQLRAFGITHLLENQDKDDPAVNRFKRLSPQTYAAR